MTLEPQAEGLAFDPVTGLLVATVRDENRLLLIDAGTGSTVREVPLPGHARHLQLAAPGGPVLVPAENSNTLVLVSLPDGETTEVDVGEYPRDAAQVEGGSSSPTPAATRCSSRERIRWRPWRPTRSPNTVAVDPDSGRLFVASRATGELQLIDP